MLLYAAVAFLWFKADKSVGIILAGIWLIQNIGLVTTLLGQMSGYLFPASLLLGAGTLFGFQVIPQAVYDLGYLNNGLMLMPPMALIICACIIWYQRAKHKELQESNN